MPSPTRTPPCRECQGEGTVERSYRTAVSDCSCTDCTEERAEREACGDLA